MISSHYGHIIRYFLDKKVPQYWIVRLGTLTLVTTGLEVDGRLDHHAR